MARKDRVRLAALVDAAEEKTGLQLAVYVGPTERTPAEHADELVAGLAERPAVLLLVAPDARRVELRTSPVARERIPDAAAEHAVAAMTPLLAEGALVAAVAAGLDALVAAAGPPVAGSPPGPELPDVLGP